MQRGCRRPQAIDEAVSNNTLSPGTSDLTVLVQTGLMHGVPTPQAERENTGNNPIVCALMARQLSVLPYLWTCRAIKKDKSGCHVCVCKCVCVCVVVVHVAMGGSRTYRISSKMSGLESCMPAASAMYN